MSKLDLDVDSPDKVADVLRLAAEAYYSSAEELDSAWQDPRAGDPWEKIARALEACAEKISRNLERQWKARR